MFEPDEIPRKRNSYLYKVAHMLMHHRKLHFYNNKPNKSSGLVPLVSYLERRGRSSCVTDSYGWFAKLKTNLLARFSLFTLVIMCFIVHKNMYGHEITMTGKLNLDHMLLVHVIGTEPQKRPTKVHKGEIRTVYCYQIFDLKRVTV